MSLCCLNPGMLYIKLKGQKHRTFQEGQGGGKPHWFCREIAFLREVFHVLRKYEDVLSGRRWLSADRGANINCTWVYCYNLKIKETHSQSFSLSIPQSQYFILFKALRWHSANQRQTLQNTSTDPAWHFAKQKQNGEEVLQCHAKHL